MGYDADIKPETALTGLVPEDLAAAFAQWEEPAYRVRQVLEWVFQRRVTQHDAMSNLSRSLREKLAAWRPLRTLRLARVQGAADTTQKLLFRLGDGRYVESVLIPANLAEDGGRADRRTLCVSSQVGCAYDCKFCASGLAGFTRNLRADEMVEQVLQAEQHAGHRIDNVVFMGMGEPLANLTNLLRTLTILQAPWGLGIGSRHITVSTSGLAPQIKKLAEAPLPVRLAISLHGATDAVRSRIMPVNHKYPLDVLFAALRHFRDRRKQKITFEYILIDGVNDDPEQARELARRAKDLSAKINLIPYNTVEGLPWTRPPLARQTAFCEALNAAGIPATIRSEKGHDIAAACGQLRLQQETAEGILPVSVP
ncbi:MAG: 23S rRNA (adenine(2503)-C(2))-methyltransferase RlmN [Verrucomicrobiales bacterium]|nr:23S rRNA (adenine(2503)-C(2))-methyltransferase RlmN [Verrucomicrobiales bacterium]